VNDTIFREYDIRGNVGQDLIIDQVYDLARAIAFYFKKHNPSLKTIAVGMDGRIHSSAIKEEICRAFTDSGIDVLFLGVCPSPALYFSLYTQPVDGGLMITASHNTKEYNGIKVCLGTESVWGKELQIIKQWYKEKKHIDAQQSGAVRDLPIIPSYLDYLCKQFESLHGFTKKIIIDCGNGAAGTVLPHLIKRMNWQHITLLYPEVDGTYPHHEADPTVAKNMQDVKRLLENTDAAFGIGLDGDCDRMAVMRKNPPSLIRAYRLGKLRRTSGRREIALIPGDQLLAVFAQQLLKKHPNAGIVFDIKSSSGLTELLEQWGAHPIMSPSGHSIIKDMMRTHNALLGGELSCHFFFKDRSFGYDDGIYAMLRFFEIIQETEKSPAQLISIFPSKYSSPEFRLSCPEAKKRSIVDHLKDYFSQQKDGSIITIDGVRVTFPFGWGIVRASNTQAALSMRFESDSKKGLQNIMERFETALIPELSPEALATLQQYKETM